MVFSVSFGAPGTWLGILDLACSKKKKKKNYTPSHLRTYIIVAYMDLFY